jgi:predicted enzyme related to lactoylglutathione lyase
MLEERTSMPVEYLQMVSVPVSSQDRAKEFYVQGLGWELLSGEGYELAGGQRLRWLEVRPRGGQTAITLVMEDNTMRAGSMKGMILRASDLESTVAELAGRGVAITREIQETPRARYASLRDPDGNTWVIQEHRAGGTD